MKVYFTCSTAQFNTYKTNYFAIRDYLIDQKHLLTREWLSDADTRINNDDLELSDIKDVYKACVTGIKKATLVLWQESKHHQFKQMFIHGIESDLLQISEYTSKNIDDILHAFLKKFEHATEKNRFHLVIKNYERMYLDWAQNMKNKSRTKVIREALKEVIDKDVEYQKYLMKE